ncbi:BPIFC [Symbiodinium natans]|uniref:BPIFC protein n=1 Tax=Symbiodinium natans TaxID=878477 RepID=A0A812ICV9_9DINO|nr:BPIFC [Symbiodinium natans]
MATPTQQQMCEHFIPILKEKGIRITKKGLRLARPARPGEEVLTIVNGEVLTRTRADVPGSMVIRQESADHEFYLLDPDKFAKNYDTAGLLLASRVNAP